MNIFHSEDRFVASFVDTSLPLIFRLSNSITASLLPPPPLYPLPLS